MGTATASSGLLGVGGAPMGFVANGSACAVGSARGAGTRALSSRASLPRQQSKSDQSVSLIQKTNEIIQRITKGQKVNGEMAKKSRPGVARPQPSVAPSSLAPQKTTWPFCCAETKWKQATHTASAKTNAPIPRCDAILRRRGLEVAATTTNETGERDKDTTIWRA